MPLLYANIQSTLCIYSTRPKCLKNVEVEVEEDDDNNDSEKYSSEMDTRSNLSSEYENDKVEMDDDNDVQNMSFDSIGSAISEMSLEDSNFENILDSSEEPEIFEEPKNLNTKTCTEFPNDAYKDLMLLVTKYKINNKGGNEIIRFFNKHSNLTESPLPKNIEQGRAFMNNMKFSNLEFSKVLITKHEDKDYFLYYQNLIQCIKNILTVPDITQNFALSYENYEYNRENATTTDTLGKSQLHPIYITLGNIPIWHRNKQDAKQLLGYLPILEAANKDLVRDTFHKSLRHLLEPIILLKDESVHNFFWDLPNINIYLATVPDRMHHLDLGLFRYQIIFTCDILKSRLMKVMIFVIDNLYDENNNKVDNFVNNDDLTKLYEYWNEMYILSRYEEFSESNLEKFNDAIHRWAQMFVKAFKFVSPSNLKLPKLHSWKLMKVFTNISLKYPTELAIKKMLNLSLRTIKRQAISIRMSQHSVNLAKTPRTCKFSARLFEFSLQDANTFFNEKKDSVDNKMQTGFARFISCLDSYLDLLDGFTIIVWFSDIAISMDSEESNDYISDKGLCYGQALLLAEVLTDPPLNLALIQCYRVYTWCHSHSTLI
ncbi:hypothetical protein GLOIN_2v1785873 [Rhizophagus clarus]|uniref:Uncharacterized protein n=1 Tax=Rhizophagus clarus TaxID=94130 RepID=A0A8H3M4R9_9GLOM|nr:hypothetical protein GLOIN_2v1785873 [Rhizophagus clarus]